MSFRICYYLRVFMCRIRGGLARFTYGTGRGLKIGKNVELDTKNIRFGENVNIYSNVHIFGNGTLIINDNVAIGDGTIICVAKKIEIGANSMIAGQCYITDCNHGTHLGNLMREQELRVKEVIIGEDVWCGCGVKVLMGSEIGSGVVLGAGLIVNGKVEDNSFCVPDRKYSIETRK